MNSRAHYPLMQNVLKGLSQWLVDG